ncbi:MAG: LysR family transcriptional regulator, partial [Kordiimonadaceae bacterium]|nr:LysR family transcriptional regulator [Kordiimonadaceae bacterium]
MNIAGLDLNLLHVFATIMKERNITRAGLKLGMSQPAVSNALNRLRHALKDDLFIRSPEGMRPTQRATELAMPISTALSDIENALKPIEFDPATATNTFTVATADYSALTWMPHLASYLSNEAPGVNLHTIPLDAHYYEKLDTQEADFVCLPVNVAEIPNRFDSFTVEVDWFVCMMRPDHPLAKYKDIPLDKYAAARHLLVTPVSYTHLTLPTKLEV